MIEYAPYELRQKSSLNRLDLSAVREGALIRKDGGYGVIHPWVELGDASLQECLDDLREGRQNRLVIRALDSVQWFQEAQPIQVSLQSHATLPKLSGSAVVEADKAGFTAVKVKRGKDWMRLRKKTRDMMEAFPELRWRFDFNGALESHRELGLFLGSIPADRVDFIEDPFAERTLAQEWMGVPLGYDRIIPEYLDLENAYLIAKPALQCREEIAELSGQMPHRVIFTSYMDHPLGQLFAHAEAHRFYSEAGVENPPLCGFITHGLYEETPYHALLGNPKPMMQVPTFEQLSSLLEREPWKPLIS